MKTFKKYYNLFILLMCVGAFPVAVVASLNLNHDDSYICKFHNDQPINNKVIACDHCSYFFDIESISFDQNIFVASVSSNVYQGKEEFTHQSKLFFYTSRSPPHSYI